MKQLMIDIETLGTSETSVVLQIGACVFDREAGQTGATFEVTGDLFAQMAMGRTTDRDTIMWWKDRPAPTWAEVSMGKALPHEMVAGFLGFHADQVSAHGEFAEIWAKGASFDFPILEHMLQSHGHVPWRYSQQRCFRTYARENDPEEVLRATMQDSTLAHTGGWDALMQARWLLAIDAARRGETLALAAGQ